MLPILYTFRRCPYAIRTRMALAYADIEVELREVLLRNKPAAMLQISPKATVPILCLRSDSGEIVEVLDESIDIMKWALEINDPLGWHAFDAKTLTTMRHLVERCDFKFKPKLDRYKYADRYPERSAAEYRAEAEVFLADLESMLCREHGNVAFLFGDSASFADIALFPFVRQFAAVDHSWWDAAPYHHVREWLDRFLSDELFVSIMRKQPPWREAAQDAQTNNTANHHGKYKSGG